MWSVNVRLCKAHQSDYIAFPSPFWSVNLVQCVSECMWVWLNMNAGSVRVGVYVGMTEHECISLSSCQTPPNKPTHKLYFRTKKKKNTARAKEINTKIKPVMWIQVRDLTLFFLHVLGVPGFMCRKMGYYSHRWILKQCSIWRSFKWFQAS